jgi:hypothetical protein
MLLKIIKIVLTLAAAGYVAGQVRKPDRFIGRLFAMLMNRSHSKLTNWGLSHVRIAKAFHILDVGCGGGRTIEKLAAVARFMGSTMHRAKHGMCSGLAFQIEFPNVRHARI